MSVAPARSMMIEPSSRPRWLLLGLALALAALCVVAIGVGALSLSFEQVVAALGEPLGLPRPADLTDLHVNVVWGLRAPRVILAALVGGGLAVAGALMQGVFRNPLAEPTLVGVSGGAALGAAIIIVLGGLLWPEGLGAASQWITAGAAFAGGAATVALVVALAGGTSAHTLLLSGIALQVIAGAGVGALTFIADDEALRSLTFWMLGSVGSATWPAVAVAAALMAPALILAFSLSRPLDALTLGERQAHHLGVPVRQIWRRAVVAVALLVGAAVALCGVIGFLGLVVPHLVRLLIGPSHRDLLRASALLGAVILVGADLAARTLAAPAEIPVGVITTLIGGPFFLGLLVQARRRVSP